MNSGDERPEIWHAGVSWWSSEPIKFFYQVLLIFCKFIALFDSVKQMEFGYPGISLRIYWRNGLQFGMTMYPDHPEDLLHIGHGSLIFLIFIMSDTWLRDNLTALWLLIEGTRKL